MASISRAVARGDFPEAFDLYRDHCAEPGESFVQSMRIFASVFEDELLEHASANRPLA